MDANKPLYYTQEHWANIAPGVIEWSEPQRRELDWLRAWARNIYSSMDPEGPVIKQPKFMRVAGESWEPFSEMARAMAVQRSNGKIVPLKDLQILQLGSAKELQRTLSKGRTAVKKEPTKRPRADDHHDSIKQPRKLTTEKTASGKEKAQDQEDADFDAASKQEDTPPAKKTRKESKALPTNASKTKPAVDKSEKTKASKLKSKSAEAEAEEEAGQDGSAGTRRSRRTRKTPTLLA